MTEIWLRKCSKILSNGLEWFKIGLKLLKMVSKMVPILCSQEVQKWFRICQNWFKNWFQNGFKNGFKNGSKFLSKGSEWLKLVLNGSKTA